MVISFGFYAGAGFSGGFSFLRALEAYFPMKDDGAILTDLVSDLGGTIGFRLLFIY